MIKHLLLVIPVLLAGCGQPKEQLNIYNWVNYMDPKIIAEFEERYHCKVNVDSFDNPEIMLAKLAAGGDSQYDLVVPSNNTLFGLIQRGLVAPLRPENIPNLRHLDPRFTNQFFDPGNRYGAPYQWGTVGIFMRASTNQAVDNTWGLIFDPAKQPGPFLLMDDLRPCIAIALKYKGYSLNSTDLKQLAEARDLLIEAKRRSLGFATGDAGKNRVLSKGAVLCVHYNNESNKAVREDSETRFFVPREGGEWWVDVLSIPAKAPHRELAEKFINFTLEPRISAQTSNFMLSATPNAAAMEFINPRDRNDPAIYPPPEIMDRLELGHDLGEKTRLYDEIWTQIKAK